MLAVEALSVLIWLVVVLVGGYILIWAIMAIFAILIGIKFGKAIKAEDAAHADRIAAVRSHRAGTTTPSGLRVPEHLRDSVARSNADRRAKGLFD